MVSIPLVTVEKISYALGDGTKSLWDLSLEAARGIDPRDIGGVIAATFSNAERFPALSVRVASALGLSPSTPAFDLQMACSAYPYAVYLAGRLSADTGRKILVVNGDVQSRLVDRGDHATGNIFSDAVTASVIRADAKGADTSSFEFLSRADDALACPETGPIRMDGMKVFTFVATEVRAFLKDFIEGCAREGRIGRRDVSLFVPHQANAYMVRQLAKSLGLEAELVTLDERLKNPGSCSIPLTLAKSGKRGLALVAGFGAGYSASAGIVKIL